MKKLELNQMEMVEGGVNQRNCFIIGGVIGAALMLSPLSWGSRRYCNCSGNRA